MFYSEQLYIRKKKTNKSIITSGLRTTFVSNSDCTGTIKESNDNSGESSETDEIIAVLEKNGVNLINSATRSKTKKGNHKKMALRIDIPASTPRRTISAFASMLCWEDLFNNPQNAAAPQHLINKKKIQYAEKMIRGGFVELYRGLQLLKTYRLIIVTLFLIN